MSDEKLSSSVRYVKNGRSSQWWAAARTRGEIHAGWDSVPDELLLKKDFAKIEASIRELHGERTGATQDFNQLYDLLNAPSRRRLGNL